MFFVLFHPYGSTLPKAYLNWILLDEQLNFVPGSSSAMQVKAGSSKQALAPGMLTMPKSGYLYVYVSNESQQDVYFDDITIQHFKGALLQEQGYYPFGGDMKGISSEAAIKMQTRYKYNAGTELESSFDINYYETYFRNYDAQVGRFTGVDALAEKTIGMTPYQFGANNPVTYNDPLGLIPQSEWNAVVGAVNSGNFSTYGGPNGGYIDDGGFHGFGSQDEAFGYAVTQFGESGSWGAHPGWATSFDNALGRYKGGGLTNGMVQGYYEQKWKNTDRGNIRASSATGAGGYGFSIGFSTDLGTSNYQNTLASVSVGSIFRSYNQMMDLFRGGGNDLNAFQTANTTLGAFDFGQGAKGELIDYAAKSSPAINDLKYVKGLKTLGYVTFGVSSAISTGLMINYYTNGGTNSSVLMKTVLDVGMGYVGFLGPIGFGVSAAYFLLDTGGAFKGWGDPLITP